MWKPNWKSFRILGSPFTAYNETKRVLHKRHRRFLAKPTAAGEVSKWVTLVTADVLGFYPSTHKVKVKKQYENYPIKKESIEDIGKMAEFKQLVWVRL